MTNPVVADANLAWQTRPVEANAFCFQPIHITSGTTVPLISSFDPWHSGLCTCPAKLTFNPYTGCNHGCLYCYATSYIPNFGDCHPKKDLLPQLRREASKLNGEIISLCNSSDPYPRLEATEGLTRRCLEVLVDCDCRIQIITKSNLVTRDDDLLAKAAATVALTITTEDAEVARKIEANAPTPSERIRAAQDLVKAGVPVSVRIDPLIPHLNSQPQKLIKTLAAIGVKHVTASTYKAKPDSWKRLSAAYPALMETLKPQYFQLGERVGGSVLLPKDYRFKLLNEVRDMVVAEGMAFGVCREGLAQLNTAACDGSWMLPKTREDHQCKLG
ncbi:MAG: radical SAM protein [Candidatus Bathyarchaeota archaeon]|nr:radical SAM protein [Candidatus Bathyarchaeota archaeon]